jgi:hypothetical protein
MRSRRTHLSLWCCVIIAGPVVAGCGGGKAANSKSIAVNTTGSHASRNFVPPRRIRKTFAEHRIRLIDELIYTSRDRPIIRSYDIDAPGEVGDLIANVFVYTTVANAIKARRFDHSKNDTQRANVMVAFSNRASHGARRRITNALNAATAVEG